MILQIKVIQYELAGRTWFRWLLKRLNANGTGGRAIAQNIKPFTGSHIANKSADRMAGLFKEVGCEVQVIHTVYKQPDNMKYSKKPGRPGISRQALKQKCKDMEKHGVSLC